MYRESKITMLFSFQSLIITTNSSYNMDMFCFVNCLYLAGWSTFPARASGIYIYICIYIYIYVYIYIIFIYLFIV